MRVRSASLGKRLVSIFILLSTLVAIHVQAEAFSAGKDYQLLPSPVPVADDSKIEVVEVFWYGCPHCRNLNPIIKAWEKQLPDDVSFELLPSTGSKPSRVLARGFYTARALGILDQVHGALFDAVIIDKMPLHQEDALQAFFEQHGVDEKTFRKVYDSPGIKTRVGTAYERSIDYRAQYVPAIVVHGKYRVDSGDAGSFERMLAITDYLIEKERQAR